jgi:hypothetical protein
LDVLSAPARKAFAEWSAHRLEIKAPLTPGSIKKLVDDAKADPALFIASVEHSIRNGWRGLFPPKDGLHAQANGHAPAPTPKLSDSPVYVDVERTPEERAAYWREFEERKAKIAAEPKYKPRR